MAEVKTSNLNFKQINAIKILDKELKRDPFLLINFNELVNDLISERDSFRKQRDELINDMQNVKRKAEAWDKLKEEKINDYKQYSKKLEEAWGFDYISRPIENYLGEMEIILKRMDQLDGTHEFQNLLSDLERSSDE